MTDWQPIETAPKDGTRVLLFYPARGPHPEDRLFVALFDPEYCGSTQWRAPTGGAIINNQPTHWMPLPEPPVGFV